MLQGNTSGPEIWTVLSSVIVDILHKRGFVIPFSSVISKNVFLLVGFIYVDDFDLIQSGVNPKEVLNSMQALINSWGSLMEVIWGVSSIDKNWWYLLEYIWKRDKCVANDAELGKDLIATANLAFYLCIRPRH